MPANVVATGRTLADVDIIDVDLLPDDPRPTQRRRLNPPDIVVLDDDDDDLVVITSNTPSTRLTSLPPPIPPPGHIPPVPPIPSHLTPYISLPLRRRPHANTLATAYTGDGAPPILPNTHPFPFEATLHATPRSQHRPRARHPYTPPPAAAPRSHHVPALGLGGALITRTRADLEPARDDPPGVLGVPSRAARFIHMLLGDDVFVNDHPARRWARRELRILRAEGGAGVNGWQFDNDGGDVDDAGMGGRAREEMYNPVYTHPAGTAASGWVSDFAPPSGNEVAPIVIDEEGAEVRTSTGAAAVETVLVCAVCLEPLLLGDGGGGSGEQEHDRRARKVWGLRCGHVLDGRCLDTIARPAVETEPNTRRSNKGKGKARAVEVDEDDDAVTAPPDVDPYAVTPMRARLRSRTGAASGSGSAPAPVPSRRKRRTRAEEFVWACPVPECARPHVSVRTSGSEGEWLPDPGRGAVGMFV